MIRYENGPRVRTPGSRKQPEQVMRQNLRGKPASGLTKAAPR
jgi:hypothetical protein